VKASPRQSKESLRELKTREGIEQVPGLNHLSSATDRCSDKSPGGESSGSGSGGVTRREESLDNDKRVRLTDEVSRLGSGEIP